MMNK
jgi:hypothetical protein